jgi:hydroxypyruvate isomerase
VKISERLAANVAWLFTEHAWLDRFGAARDAGFAAVEFPWPQDPAATADAVRASGLRVAQLNVDAGDLAAGERGWPNDPSRVDEWRAALTDALRFAGELRCPTVNVLAGNRVAGASNAEQLACLADNLRWALPRAADVGAALVTELLNRDENPDYLLVTFEDAQPLLDVLGPLGWRLQVDTWHLGLTVPDVPGAIRRMRDYIGHVQVADVPGRHEPGSGALDWEAIGAALVDYGGAIGLEYVPAHGTVPGLATLPAALSASA